RGTGPVVLGVVSDLAGHRGPRLPHARARRARPGHLPRPRLGPRRTRVFAGAEASFREALRRNPVPAMIALALICQRRFTDAVMMLTEAVRLELGMPEVHHWLGYALASQGRRS